MPLPTTHSRFVEEIDRLRLVYRATAPAEWQIRGPIAELLLLRTYSMIEWLFEEATLKLLLGNTYCDGQASDATARVRSRQDALSYVKAHHPNALRATNPITPTYLKWSNVDDVERNVANVLSPTGAYRSTIGIHKSRLNQMRHVRNHCAHRSASTKAKYNSVVKGTYGAHANLSVAVFLLSDRRANPPVLERYFVEAIAFCRDLTKA